MNKYTMDSKFNVKNSHRFIDDNGYMTINNCVLTKEGVAEYLGMEIPNFEAFGLDPNKLYKVFRPLEVLENHVDTFNNLPITLEHPENLNSESFKDIKTYGATGEKSFIKDGKLYNNMILYDNDIIALIENGDLGDLSCGYFWNVEKSDNKDYDFIITEIKGNHLAIVEEPRIEGAKIADSNNKTRKNKKGVVFMKKLKKFFIKDSEEKNHDSHIDEFSEKLAHLLEEYELEDKVKVEFKEEIEDEHHSEDESENERRRHEAVGSGEYDVEHGEHAGGSYKKDSENETNSKDSYTKDEVDEKLKEFKDELLKELREEEEEIEDAMEDAKDILGDVSCGAKDSISIRKAILDAKGISTKGMNKSAIYGAVKALKSTKVQPSRSISYDSRKNSFNSSLLDRIGGIN